MMGVSNLRPATCQVKERPMRSPRHCLNLISVALFLATLVLATPLRAETKTLAGALTSAELDQLVAPIALYPDDLLSQVLMASTYPLEVIEAARWSRENAKVTGQALQDAMQKQDWDPSV